jgi:hypothetical protein
MPLVSIIPEIEKSSRKVLIEQLKSKGIEPKSTLKELKQQARQFNNIIRHPCMNDEDGSSVRLPTKQIAVIGTELSGNSSTETSLTSYRIPATSDQERSHFPPTDVSKWNISYDGKSDIQLFLCRVLELCRSRNFCVEHLPKVFVELLTGDALVWFRSIYHDSLDWIDLRKQLLEEFETPYSILQRKAELYAARQQENESAGIFIAKLVTANKTLSSPVKERELVEIVRKGLLPKYSTLVSSNVDRSLSELERLCKSFDKYSRPATRAICNLVSQNPPVPRVNKVRKCHLCQKVGHFRNRCPNQPQPSRIIRRSPRNNPRPNLLALPAPTPAPAPLLPNISVPPPSLRPKNWLPPRVLTKIVRH